MNTNIPFNFLMILVVSLLIACSSSDNNSDTIDNFENSLPANYELSFEVLDKYHQPSNSFEQNEQANFRVTISNITGDGVTIWVGDGCADAYEIYNLEKKRLGPVPKSCLPVLPIEKQLLPGDTFSFNSTWFLDYMDPSSFQGGIALEPGTYIVEASVSGLSEKSTASVTIK